jgi:hypothetical protein
MRLLAGILALAAGCADIPASQPQAHFQRTMAAWFECVECRDGELDAVTRLGQAAVPTLAAALRDGPSAARREEARRQSSGFYRRLAHYAQTHPEARLKLSEAEYVELYLGNMVARTQIRAAAALGEIGGSAALGALENARRSADRRDVGIEIESAAGKLRPR